MEGLKKIVISNNKEIKLTDLIQKNACKESLCWVIENCGDIKNNQKVRYEHLIWLLDRNGRSGDSKWVRDNFPQSDSDTEVEVELDIEKHKILFEDNRGDRCLTFYEKGKLVKGISKDKETEFNIGIDIRTVIGLVRDYYWIETQDQLVQIMKDYF